MHAWAGIAIAQTALIVFSLWRAFRGDKRAHKRGVVLFVVAALAMLVFVPGGGYWAAIAVFATIVLASDVLFLQSALVTSLCTRPAPPVVEDEPKPPADEVPTTEVPTADSQIPAADSPAADSQVPAADSQVKDAG